MNRTILWAALLGSALLMPLAAQNLRVTTSSLPEGTRGAIYAARLEASGGSSPYAWRIQDGTLPLGLLLIGDLITGVPLNSGTASFTVRVTDSANDRDNQALTLTIRDPLAVTTTALPAGMVGRPYAATLQATGGATPYSWSATGLPPGLVLSPSGAITGTPTEAGTALVTFSVSDPAGRNDTQRLNLSVEQAAPPLEIATAGLPAGTVGAPYSATVTASGGTGNYTWSAAGLPGGLAIDPASGAISGTPTTAGSTQVTVTVNDGSAEPVSRAYTLVVNNPPLAITTASFPPGTVGAPYSATVAASGGTGNYTWSATGLPGGLAIDAASGTISGTPTTAGSTQVTVTVNDGSAEPVSRAYTLVVNNPPLAITTASLPPGTVGAPYSASVAASGGSGNYTWSAAGLPGGLAIDAASGTISGTPATAGSTQVTVTVNDGSAEPVSRAYTLVVNNPPLAITTASLPPGTVGAPYSASVAASGGTGNYTWSATGLPGGLAIDAASGTISGTPATAGSTQVTVTVNDGSAEPVSRSYTLTINNPALAITTPSLPAGTVGQAYSATIAASGGTGNYTWSATGLPGGLAIDATTGTITGTPTTAGTSNVTITVNDGSAAPVSRSYTLTVNNPALAITTPSLPAGTVGEAYSATAAASGGTGNYTWSATGLPGGLAIDATTGSITGTPTTAGTSNVTITVSDGSAEPVSRTYTLTINNPALAITTPSLPAGTAGQAYSATITATGGTGNYTWSATGLPGGLSIGATTGTITGTPTTAGTSNVTVTVSDGSAPPVSRAYTLTINNPALAITTPSLPAGTAGQAYSATVAASGGTGNYSWSARGLPGNLTINATTGAITGTPTTAGSAQVNVTVSDGSGSPAVSRTYTLTINNPALAITTPSLPAGTAGQAYSATVAASGGTGNYTWSATGLPGGLSIGATTGTITGTPATAGTSTVTITVNDGSAPPLSRTYTLTVNAAALIVNTPALPAATAGTPYAATLNAGGGVPPYTWSATGLPANLTLSANGTISGTPAQSGTSAVSVTVRDTAGTTANRSYNLTVNAPALIITTASLPGATAGTPYSATVTGAGGTPPYNWSATGLPNGLSMSTAGVVSGTPTQSGDFQVTLRLADTAGVSTTRVVALPVAASPVRLTACPAGSAIAAQPYSSAATTGGGVAPFVWSIRSGQVPPGINLNTATGSFTGTPTQAGNFTFVLRVTDVAGSVADAPCGITVAPALALANTLPPRGVVGSPYSSSLAASGGAPPYVWSIAAGTLPPGLSLDPATGAITGVPTQPGTWTARLRVRDAAAGSAEREFAIEVVAGLSVTACPQLTGTAGAAYSSAFAAAGGVVPYTWSLSYGGLPSGLSLGSDSGRVTGTPGAAGSYEAGVVVTDATGQTATRICTFRIAAPLTIPTLSLAGSNLGVAYSDRVAVTGGNGPYEWSTVAGALPPGLSLNTGTGQITGTPTFAGDFSFTIRVIDATGSVQTREYRLSVSATLQIADCPTPAARAGELFVYALSAGGGQSPYAWSLASGALPEGLQLNPVTGVVAGTPAEAGTSQFTLRVTEAGQGSATRACTILITPARLAVTTPRSLPAGTLGVPYQSPLAAAGGRAPYTWAVADGSLPPGLTLTADGALGGTPTTAGLYTFTVRVTDADRNLANQLLELRVLPAALENVRVTGAPAIVAPAQQLFPDVEIGQPYPVELTGVLRMAVTPDPGLSEDPSVRFASGTREVPFTIPSGATKAVFAANANGLQTGTVAGTIRLEATLNASGLDVTPAPAPAAEMRVDRLAPRIVSATGSTTTDGVQVVIIAFSTTRELTQGTFRFTPAAGSTLGQSEFTVDLRTAGAAWFGNAASAEHGGQFRLTVPFRVSGARVSSVAVTLTNGQGTSEAVTVSFP